MLTVLALLALGISIGYLIKNREKICKCFPPLVIFAVYILLFLLGASVGGNKTVICNLYSLGLKALILTLGGISGSVFVSMIVYKLFFKGNK
ncbi:LysO family transporter [candidate division WOR-3 bacterium]|nr:LysO family transporter [candidate division WOR-3 bacterium]